MAEQILSQLPAVTVTAPFPTTEEKTTIGLAQQRGGVALCRVSFYNGKELFQLNGTAGGGSESDPLDGDLISVQTHKDIGAPAGTFTITLHDRPIRTPGPFKGRALADVIAPMDLVVISFGRIDADGKGKLDPVAAMIGFVGQAPQEVEALGENNVATHQLVVTGFDFGKLLLNAVLTYFRDVPTADIRLFAARNLTYLKDGKFPAGPKAHVMAWVMEKVFYPMVSLNYNVAANEKTDVKQLFGYRFGSTYGQLFEGMNFLADEEATVWNLLESIAERTWCEMFVECMPAANPNYLSRMVRGGELGPQALGATHQGVQAAQAPRTFDGAQAWLIMRQAPFSREDWEKLPVVEIDDTVVKAGNVGGEPTVYNVFYARPTGFLGMDGILKGLEAVPRFDQESYHRHGYRPLVVETRVFPWTDRHDIPTEPRPTFRQVAEDLTARLHEWFAPSLDFLAGSMTVQGHSAYRVGTRLRRTYLGKQDPQNGGAPYVREFYVEGVSHSFNVYGTWDTTVRLTRGLPLRGFQSGRFARVASAVSAAGDDPYPWRK